MANRNLTTPQLQRSRRSTLCPFAFLSLLQRICVLILVFKPVRSIPMLWLLKAVLHCAEYVKCSVLFSSQLYASAQGCST